MFPSSTSHKRRSACLIELSKGQKPGNILALPHGVSPPNNYWGYPLVPHDDSQLEHKVENQLVVMMGRRTRKKTREENSENWKVIFEGALFTPAQKSRMSLSQLENDFLPLASCRLSRKAGVRGRFSTIFFVRFFLVQHIIQSFSLGRVCVTVGGGSAINHLCFSV